MKRLVFFLILPLQLFSQAEIDQIRSDSDVVNFIMTKGPAFVDSIQRPYLKPVTFDIFGRYAIYREKMDTDDGHFTDSITARRWIVEDFTGDNMKDLVYYGKIGDETGVYLFIPGKNTAGHLVRLTSMFARHLPHSIELHKKGNANLLILGSVTKGDWPVSKQQSIRERYYQDTLVYKSGFFAHYNEAPKRSLSFDSIEYRFITNWSSNRWYMRIYGDGTALYVRERDSVDRPKKESFPFVEKLTMKIDPQEWRDLIGYIKFEGLDEKYELRNVSDQTTGITTVYFTNGTQKTVRDYGLRGTYGLQTLYYKIYHTSQQPGWKLVKKNAGYLHNNPQF